MEQTIDLEDLFKIIKKNFFSIVALPLLFGIIALLISMYLITPKYESTTQLLVNQKENENSILSQQVQSNLKLIQTYSEIIKSPRILDEVSNRLDNRYTTTEIQNMLNISSQSDSQVLNISVKSEHSELSNTIANTVAEVFSEDVENIMNVDNVSILSVAEGNGEQVEPRTLVNVAVGMFVGFILAALIIFLKEVLDKRIKNEDDVAEYLDLPVLGSIEKVK
ncbi:capsule biosynthesis protein CapA [Nosocomiicoccus sp. HMSC067E10]|uniref:YveK family protein n=1 Tax=Nosocomiicoccus sp. HMSC067E10 TaxID=1739271 RepID=UPI0008A24325|nr:Wzz/FepE/Etk N-terminal domain-containing protein [Nosocomiicoccus sp. HMSC067E10]OFL49105.1 capsule biosynthesis protein CapA [Nosocomiicoccus sp. HMSC067E10]